MEKKLFYHFLLLIKTFSLRTLTCQDEEFFLPHFMQIIMENEMFFGFKLPIKFPQHYNSKRFRFLNETGAWNESLYLRKIALEFNNN